MKVNRIARDRLNKCSVAFFEALSHGEAVFSIFDYLDLVLNLNY